MLVALDGMVTVVRFESLRNALSGIEVSCEPAANDTLVSAVMLWNAARPMLVTVLGIVMLVTLVSPLKASSPMLVTPVGIETLVSEDAPQKAFAPIVVTLLGIETLEREVAP
jgi:hypothetical protein